jgi:tetratricopeptide (TPR) repeat protein
VLSLILLTSYSFADDLADANKLLKARQFPEAMQKVDSILSQRPKDAQMRFLKGLILVEQNKSPEAIAIFLKLTDDYPELPEPYNNLAVLYASAGQYDKSRAALEMAIRTNPTYGTAHENLGDIYAKLASQAYDKALQLDTANTGAKLKLTLVKSLIGNTTGGTNPKVAIAPAAPIQTPPKVTVPVPVPVPVPAINNNAQVAVAKKQEPEPAKPEAKSVAKPAVVAKNDESDVIKAVEDWAKAWSDKETNAYLSHYSKDFETPRNVSRKAWTEERRARIEDKGRIDVTIQTLNVKVEDKNTASAKFRQIYSSDRFSANSRKTLELVKQDGKWLIKTERTGH